MINMRQVNIILIVLACTVVYNCAPASLFSDHWNKIGPQEFERTESPYTDSPDAVVVFDREKMYIDSQEWDIIRERHVRIQIFTEAGKEYADVSIPYWHTHRVTEIKAHTILPDGSRIKLNKDDIFEEGNEKRWMYKVFALPGVEEQCIIEYQYKYRSTNIAAVQPKYFQSYLRTEYSLFSMTLTQGFEYTALTRNLPPSYREPERLDFDTPYEKNLSKYTWEFYDLPPVKDEPYMYNREDHLFSISMQMVRYRDPYNDITFIKEWEDLTKYLLDEHYDSYMHSSGALKKLLAEIQPEDPTAGLQPRDIFVFVRDRLTRSSANSKYPDPMKEVIKRRQGSPVEKNLLMTALMRLAGYNADPVLISQRFNGRVNPRSPSIGDFNHVIVRLDQNKKLTLHDAGYTYSTFDLMPASNYSGAGLVLTEGESDFVLFPTDTQVSRRNVVTTCKLDETGTLTGSFQISSTGYYASSSRSSYADAKDDETFAYDNIVDHLPGVIVDSVTVETNADDFRKPVVTLVHFQIPEYFVPGSDLSYLPTTFFHGFRSNSLVKDERNHDIEFYKTFNIKEVVNLELPPGYEVVETPDNANIRGPGIAFQKRIQPIDNMVQIAWTQQLNKLVHPPSEYKKLRDFYTDAVAVDQAVLVIKPKE